MSVRYYSLLHILVWSLGVLDEKFVFEHQECYTRSVLFFGCLTERCVERPDELEVLHSNALRYRQILEKSLLLRPNNNTVSKGIVRFDVVMVITVKYSVF